MSENEAFIKKRLKELDNEGIWKEGLLDKNKIDDRERGQWAIHYKQSEEITRLRTQLAKSEADAARMREALEACKHLLSNMAPVEQARHRDVICPIADKALYSIAGTKLLERVKQLEDAHLHAIKIIKYYLKIE